MAKSNRDRIGDIIDALKAGLGPFVLREYKFYYKGSRYLQEVELTLNSKSYSPPHLPDAETALREVDAYGWLTLMIRQWHDVFRSKLGHSERSYVGELLQARNDWAHQGAFTNDQAYRVADTAARLLQAIGAPKEAQIAQDIAQELLRLRFDSEAKKSTKKKTISLDQTPTTTTPGLKPWRMVVQPHPDVASGRYIQAEFAADLAQVVQGKADPEYGDPKEFFRRTYLTEGLMDLLVTGIKRLNGQGGDPVVQLQTSFGGGKTHSMLALYHLLGGQIGFSEIPGGEDIVGRIGEVDDHIDARRAVIVGTAFSPTEPRQYADCTTHTLWGDIAYQIGGIEAYRVVEKADLTGVSPGSDTILQLLEDYGPALLIIDELVAFARNLYNVSEHLPAGSFDAVMTFMQSLTEAVKRSSDSMLLVSIPESDIEIGGEGGKAALDILSKTIGRIESVWKPVTATESFEIVRRRLFSSEMDYAARDAVLSAFREMYAKNTGEFPSGVAESDYLRRMKDAYPIHPELFARLYEDWSTLDRFQRTRGVLRLMATVIHQLWANNDQSLMIMPASIPLWTATVRNEMLRYLPENWPAILDADIDGEHSKPYQIDKSIPTLGQYTASRRVARAIFVGSAPSVAAQSVRGIEEVRVRLATVQPGEQLAAFNDALRRMSNQLTYLYTDGSRYWYDTHPTVNRIAQDRAQTIHADLVYQEAIDRLKAVRYTRDTFTAVHIAPQKSGDVADEWRFRVVVLELEYGHKRNGGNLSQAQEVAKEILENRGNSPRLYRNMLVFIAPDATNATAWEQSLREYLAWKSIDDEAEPLNLDAQQRKQVATALQRTEETLLARLEETYSWLIVPTQPEPTGPIHYDAHRIAGQANFYERAAQKLHQSEFLIPRWSPDNLRGELDRYLWHDQPHVGVKQLWEYFARYCYLPRLYDKNVLLEALNNGVMRSDAPFGYATMVGEDGVYKGLAIGSSTNIYFDNTSVIIRPEVAQAQIEATEQTQSSQAVDRPATSKTGVADAPSTPTAPPQPRLKTRYHGTVSLDPQRTNKEMATIVEEIVQRLTSLTGTQVEITLEISAERASGFDDATVRTISENSRTLKFKNHGFEE
ncbi:MAG: ATP-binding protein [Anaerolineaceae bacterium]|nr:MAG: ATP-binding protein [Anaerolineaceae bacterium]